MRHALGTIPPHHNIKKVATKWSILARQKKQPMERSLLHEVHIVLGLIPNLIMVDRSCWRLSSLEACVYNTTKSPQEVQVAVPGGGANKPRRFTHKARIVAILVLVLIVQFWQLSGHAALSHRIITRPPSVSSSSSSSVAPEEELMYDPHQLEYSYPFTFAACLIVKDDGLRLPEWLAYHYTVMPLRHLIIAADPLSITSPASLLEDYRTYTNLTIDFWTGNGYFKDGRWSKEKFDLFDPYNHTRDHQYGMHLHRQNLFYTACIRKLKARMNATWTLLIDSDEFVTYHTPLAPPPHEQQQQRNESSSSSRSLKQQIHKLRQTLPTHIGRQNETVAHWIHTAVRGTAAWSRFFRTQLCVKIAELRMTSGTSNGSSVLQSHQFRSYTRTTAPGKAMVNLEHYNNNDKVTNCHHPFGPNACVSVVGDRKWFDLHQENIFRFQHYSGSLEVFLSRPGRDAEYFWHRNKGQALGATDSLTAWYPQFVQLVGGTKVAQRLTVDAYRASLQEWNNIKDRLSVDEDAAGAGNVAITTIPLAFTYDRPNQNFLQEQLGTSIA